MKRSVVVCLAFAVGCSGYEQTQRPVANDPFDCTSVSQRLTCASSDDLDRRFVCHATPHHYVKISVSASSPQHVPGVADASGRMDQAPGASGVDVGDTVGLDCDCAPRVCIGTCTGAAAGTSCDDFNHCTGDGTCAGDTCVAGAPTCNAGTAIDACNVQIGECDADTGECFTEPLPAGTVCDDGGLCRADGDCVPHVVINEIESSGGVPGDWVELYNAGTGDADVSGWRLLDADDTHAPSVIAAGTVIAPGGYLVVEESGLGFGLGGADSVRLFDASSVLVDTYAWTAHAATTYGRCGGADGDFTTTTSVTKGAANDCGIAVRINEVESSGGVPGDWVELFNAGPVTVDLSGFIFRDSDDAHAYVIPSGTTIAPADYYVLEEAAFDFGLGAADAARLFDAMGTPIDTYAWTAHAATTYGRCPNGSGAFATTGASSKGTANACGTGGAAGITWPGRNAVTTFGTLADGNVSGLYFDGSTLWAVQNNPATLYEVNTSGVVTQMRTLVYPDGTGIPDGEDLTRAEAGSSAMYVATERDNAVSMTNRLSVLRYDTSAPGSTLVATHEWNLTADLPGVTPNFGLEAITWVPDSALVAAGFFDPHAGHLYNPADYPNHGTGLFFVGLETNGVIYVYALDHATSGFTRITSIVTGDVTTKALYYDRDVGYLWSYCGTACGNQATVMKLGSSITSVHQVARPSTMANLQNEGIAIAPESQCVAGQKSFWWTDDGATDGHALRVDTIACGAF